MTPEEIRRAVFRTTMWRGYCAADVDRLLERVAIQLEAGQSPATTIDRTELRTANRGYDMQQVDRLLDRARGLPVEPDDPLVPSRRKRSGPEWMIRVVVFLGLLAALSGYILYRVEPKSQNGLWETTGLVGLAVLVGWQTFMKLTATTAFDDRFDVRYFLMGLALFVGGFGGLVAHLDRLTVTSGVLWIVAGVVGSVFLYAEYRGFRLRQGEQSEAGGHAGPRADRRDGAHFRRS